MMKASMRTYRDENDYWKVRQFLRDVFLLNSRREMSWQAYRFDYCRWHVWANITHYRIEDVLFIWERPDGGIVGVLNPEGRNGVFLHVHPELRTPGLEAEMITVAEESLALPSSDGPRTLCIWANEHDEVRKETLVHWGYTRGDKPEYQRRRDMSEPIAGVRMARGYTVRPLGGADELPARSWVSWRAFHPDDPDEDYEGHDWYLNVQRVPLYRRDLDIVAVAPDGEFASFCTVWFDDVTRTGAFEPVGTAPEHQRKGLGRAVMAEGLTRLQHLGATLAYVGGFTPEANALYSSVGFEDYDLCEPWTKEV
jgi:GNAT superfamily N-acetyltransferase